MVNERSSMRQRNAKAATEQPSQTGKVIEEEAATPWDQFNFYIAQHIGLVWCTAGEDESAKGGNAAQQLCRRLHAADMAAAAAAALAAAAQQHQQEQQWQDLNILFEIHMASELMNAMTSRTLSTSGPLCKVCLNPAMSHVRQMLGCMHNYACMVE
jgi:hypothetical protein